MLKYKDWFKLHAFTLIPEYATRSIMVALILNAQKPTPGVVPCLLTDFWGKEFSFLIPADAPASKISKHGVCYLECRFLSESRHTDGKHIRVVKTDLASTDGTQLFEVGFDDVWGDHSHNEGTEILHPISPCLFSDIGIDSNWARHIYLNLRALPRFFTMNCECGPLKVSSLAMYAECPRCGFHDKIRHRGGGSEFQDIIIMVAQWLGMKDRSLMDSLKLHPDDDGAPVDWEATGLDTYYKVTQEEIDSLRAEYSADDRIEG